MKKYILRSKIFIVCAFVQLLCGFGFAQSAWHKVASNDCGVDGSQPYFVRGESYVFPSSLGGSPVASSCTFGDMVIYAFDKMDIHANYQLEALFFADNDRVVRLMADGNEIAVVEVPKGKEQKIRIDLPRKAYAYSQLVLMIDALRGSNAVISELNLYSSNPKELKSFGKEEKTSLVKMNAFSVDSTVCAETVLPDYAPVPSSVAGIYTPVISLNGLWKMDGKPVVVPGQWSMQGYAVDSAEFTTYTRDFEIPADWSNARVMLRFDAVFSESVLFINDKEVGSHMGGLTAFEYDVTPYLNGGMNSIKLKIRSESLADMLGSLTQYAAHQLGGITRKVTLFALPQTYISDLRIETDLDSVYTDAELKLRVSVKNFEKKSSGDLSVRVTLNGLPVVLSQKLPLIKYGEEWSGELSAKVLNPLKWNNETPNLYMMNVELLQNNKSIEQIEKRFGFREVEVDGNRLLVNGQAVKLRGVCRHEAHPTTGRVLTTDLQKEDIILYRNANCNFIRTSHYPPSEEFVELCDELGMFVELEAPVCWIGHHANENWQKLNYKDPKYYPYVLQANMEMIHFYRNSPSVIFWSMANESYWNKEFAQVLEYMKKADTTRPSAFHDQGYGGFNNQGSTAAIANIHYPGPNGYKVPAVAESSRPMVFGEYCHLNVYNRSELVTDPGVRSDWALALDPMWESMYKTPAILGGSIWSGIDDVFQLIGGDAVGYGPWGPIDGWRRPKPEYWDMKKIYSPVKVKTTSLEPSKMLTVELENRYTYLNVSELTINWKFGVESGISLVDLAPGKTDRFNIAVQDLNAANELYISFTDPRGFVIDEYLIPVGKQVQNELPELTSLETKLKIKADEFKITGKNFECVISAKSGQIIKATKDGQIILKGGPTLMALPLEGGGCYPNHNANTPIFNDLCSDWKAKHVEAKKDGDDVIVTVLGSYKEFDGGYTLCINASGKMVVTYNFKSLIDVNPRQWGLVFDAVDDFTKTFWRREGLWSVYPDDHISRPAGEAEAFYEGLPEDLDPRVKPMWSWNRDFNELGSNDFRSTRRNIWFAGLSNAQGKTVTAVSDAKQHWRSWKDPHAIRFLIANFVTAGYEMFLGSYYAPYRKPIKKGDSINGTVTLRIE